MAGGFIGEMWYEEKTYNEKINERALKAEAEQAEREKIIDEIIELKTLKSGVKIISWVQRDRLSKVNTQNLRARLDKWRTI